MNYKGVLFLLLYLRSIEADLICPLYNEQDDCLCTNIEKLVIQCPGTDPKLTITITEEEKNKNLKRKRVEIKCNFANDYLIPNMSLRGIDYFHMNNCSLLNNFKEILAKFSTDQVKTFQFGETNLTGLTLTKEYFSGLKAMEELVLRDLELLHLDEDVFANTPNLKFLELQQNRIVLTANLFKHTPRLTQLVLVDNKIDSLPYGIFEPLKDLERLYFHGNKLMKHEGLTFLGLNKVVILELSCNGFKTMDEAAFGNLTQLKQIHLSSNKLKVLPPLLFTSNKKLKVVRLSSNLNLKLPELLMANLPELQDVFLDNLELEHIPSNLFENSTNLRILNLDYNKLKFVPVFLQDTKNLEQINLSHNNLTNISDGFSSLRSLTRLSLKKNQITELEETAFAGTNNLVKIDLSFNKIEKIHNKVFESKSKLKTINLAHNLLGNSQVNDKDPILMNALAVEDLDLSFNLISQVDQVLPPLDNMRHLTNLDLSHNQITYILVREFQPMTTNLELNLANNNITVMNFASAAKLPVEQDYRRTVMTLDDNPIDCDCSSEDLVKYFKNTLDQGIKRMFDISSNNVICASPPFLKGQPVQKLDPMSLTCPLETKCPDECSCLWRPAESAIVINCTGQNLTEFPAIQTAVNQTFSFIEMVLYLDHNFLSEGPSGKLDGYKDITKLYLAHNRIKELTWVPPKLEVLDIRYNALENIDYKVLQALNTLTFRRLLLSNNPWDCQCQIHSLTNFLRHSTQKVDTKDVYCYNSTKKVIDLDRNSICPMWLDMYTAFVVLLVLLLVAICVAVYYRQRIYIKEWSSTDNFEEEKTYDAFISYSSKDSDFVQQNLIPVLEGGPEPFKLCVDYRNFVPGEIITKQITNSIFDSKRTLVILSKNFIDSVWTKLEFRTAHTQAMIDGKARVIVIIFGDIDTNSLSKELKLYLKHTNYLKWGEMFFWHRLKKAMPHRKLNKGADNQKHANMMAYIDDKFNLVPSAVVSTNSESTPVIPETDDLNPRNEPLSFVPNLVFNTPSGTLLTTTNT